MDQQAAIADAPELRGDPPFRSVIDVAGTVGQFLLNTDDDDIIVELVQNELDAGSAHTRLLALGDRLVCEGTGRPVEADGWDRLRFILAAGGETRPKPGGIGAKNHGLRVGFRLGDDIWVQSGGLKTVLTTRRDGARGRFLPGAWERAIPDPRAPALGTRVSILYRRHKLTSGAGSSATEGLELPATSVSDADRLLREAAAAAAVRFIGVSHPERLPRYVLEFVPSDGRTIRFTFACRAVRSSGGRMGFLERTVTRSDGGDDRLVLRERAVRFPLRGLPRRKAESWFFGGGAGGVEAEISWEVGPGGRPRAVEGACRYPIAYRGGERAATGLGFHVSAPFTSDQARHGPAAGDTANDAICEQAARAAAELLAKHLVPSSGPPALELLRPPGRITDATRRLLGALAEGRRLPIQRATPKRTRGDAARSRTPSKAGARHGRPSGPVLLPVIGHVLDAALAELCPKQLPRISHAVPPFVVAALLETSRPELYRPFRLSDVVDRMCGKSNAFPWASDAERVSEFADPVRASVYLRLLERHPDMVRARALELKAGALLPNSHGMAVAWSSLSRADAEPPSIPHAPAPEILHRALGRYAKILGRGPVAVPRFDLDEYVIDLDWSEDPLEARGAFFNWLVGHAKRLRPATLRAIAAQPVFPATDGSFHALAGLCDIRQPGVRRAMAGHVKVPSERVKSLARARRGAFQLRKLPTDAEVRSWYASRRTLLGLVGGSLGAADLMVLDALENDMDSIRRQGGKEAQNALRAVGHVTASRAGVLRAISDLHLDTESVAANGLLDADVVPRRHTALYDWLGARKQPSADALRRALERADGDEALFFRRIAAYLNAEGDPQELRALRCVPTAGGLQLPAAVCIKGLDLWGDWKVPLAVRVPERQRNLQDIGVVGPGLTEAASQAFFMWLAGQGTGSTARHRQVVARHWADPRHGPLRWWDRFPDSRCLPVFAQGSLRLISRREAYSGRVFLPDFPGIHEQVAGSDMRHMIVDDALALGGCLVALRRAGIPGLRESLGAPTCGFR